MCCLRACRLKGLNTAELMIYQLVEKELNMGALLLAYLSIALGPQT